MPLSPRLRNSAAIVLILTFGLTTPTIANEVKVDHAQGQTILSAVPEKAAVFDMASLDILNAIGVNAVAGVPKNPEGPSNFPEHIGKYAEDGYTAVGTLFEPDVDALKALSPDLIIVGGRSRNQFDAVKEIAPTIDMTAQGTDIAAIAVQNTTKLGQIFGAEDRAAEQVTELEAAVAALREQGKSAGKGLVLFTAGKGISAHAPGSRFGSVYEFVGIPSVLDPVESGEVGPRPEPGTPEAEAAAKKQAEQLAAALSANPDWIFVLDRSAAVGSEPSNIAERLKEDKAVTATKAWQDGHVVYLDAKTWYLVGAGIDALTASAEDIRAEMTKTN